MKESKFKAKIMFFKISCKNELKEKHKELNFYKKSVFITQLNLNQILLKLIRENPMKLN